MVSLGEKEVRRRAQSIRLVLSDVDGVLTDGAVYVSPQGEELKRFSMRDGMGVERLRDAGIETALVTRERSRFASARAAKLGIVHLYLGVGDKAAHLKTLEADTGVNACQTAYVGDDVNDVDVMRRVLQAGGLTAAPADAFDEVLGVAAFVSTANGGHGAFRDVAEWLLRLRRAARGPSHGQGGERGEST